MRFTLIAAALAACAGADRGVSAAPSALQGGAATACAGLDESACRANAACFWYVDTRPCRAGEACPPNRCVDRAPGPADPRMACGCAAANSSVPQVCVRSSGSTAVACEPVPAGCSAPSVDGTDVQTAAACACLSTAARTCRAAKDIRALCDCG